MAIAEQNPEVHRRLGDMMPRDQFEIFWLKVLRLRQQRIETGQLRRAPDGRESFAFGVSELLRMQEAVISSAGRLGAAD